MKDTAAQEVIKLRIQESTSERERVRNLVNEGRWREAELETERKDLFRRRELRTKAQRLPLNPGAEAMQGDTDDLQGGSFLPEGSQIRRAVAYVEVNTPESSASGTGFLISPELFITNQHVIENVEMAKSAEITFDRELDENGRSRPVTTFLLDPDRFALFSPEHELDFALIAVGNRHQGSGNLTDFGYSPLSDLRDKHVIGMSTNIIQHPSGRPKMIAVRNNILMYRTENTLLYESDTERGSSGAPVFNDDWDLVALHHYGEPTSERDDEGKPIPRSVNEGIRISAIYKHLNVLLPTLSSDRQRLLGKALELFKRPMTTQSIPRPEATSRPEVFSMTNYMSLNEQNPGGEAMSNQEIRVSIPIEVMIRVGQPTTETAAKVQSTDIPKPAPGAAEAVRIDNDYANRNGYNSRFVPGSEIPLPTVLDPTLVAPLKPDQPNPQAGELRYQHFSLKMHANRRMALFTATNIDGSTYLSVDRNTGRIQPEGERWFKDRRIEEHYCLDQPFFSEWSEFYDRGHLTRRTDPTWGTPEEAERANADTFHFTNCTPQHWRFNQSTQFWQGLERYVLEEGVLRNGGDDHITVFQGPVFDDERDVPAEDVLIPLAFWKIVVWKGQHDLKAVGLLANQKRLLGERRGTSRRRATPTNVAQFRVPIQDIQSRTGLEFGQAIRQADTIGQGNPPRVGAEAMSVRELRSWGDILL